MNNIRSNVFETNSSSTHSISIDCSSPDEMLQTILPDENGIISLTGGQFGREWKRYNDCLTKANYSAIDCLSNDPEKMQSFINIIKRHTGAKEVVLDINLSVSYIDHGYLRVSKDVLYDENKLINFIFNPKSWLFLGNDNEDPPTNFYNGNKEIKYKYELKVEGINEVMKFTSKPNRVKIKDELHAISRYGLLDTQSYEYDDKYEFFYFSFSLINNEGKRFSRSSFYKMKDNLFTLYKLEPVLNKKGIYIGERILSEKDFKFELIKL
jgi:hypothetical protein